VVKVEGEDLANPGCLTLKGGQGEVVRR